MKLFKDKIILSTNIDSQGEKLTKEELELIFKQIDGKRVPIGQNHDAAENFTGYFENARIVEDEKNSNEHCIVADIYCDESKLNIVLGGLSYSAIKDMFATGEDPLFGIYLPFPYYNDQATLNAMKDIDTPVVVGKWIKKDASPIAIAIISTLTSILLSPIWTRYYNKHIAPELDSLLDSIYLNKKLKYDLAIKCKDQHGHDFTLHFTSKKRDLKSLRSSIIKTGIKKTFDYINKSDKAKTTGIAMVRLIYNESYSRYDLLNITFKNGEVDEDITD